MGLLYSSNKCGLAFGASIFGWRYEDLYLGINFLQDKTTSLSIRDNRNIVLGLRDAAPKGTRRTQCSLLSEPDNLCIVRELALSKVRVSIWGPFKHSSRPAVCRGQREVCSFFSCDVL